MKLTRRWCKFLLMCSFFLLPAVHALPFKVSNPHRDGWAAVSEDFLVGKARATLGLPPPGNEEEAGMLSEVVEFMYNTRQRPGRMGLTVSSQVPIAYLRIFKCGNDNVRCNMGCCHDRNPPHEVHCTRAHDIESTGRMISSMVSPEVLAELPSNLTVFTFVREPAEKFISGFIEMCFRMGILERPFKHDPCRKYRESDHPLGDFLADLLSTDVCARPSLDVNHYAPVVRRKIKTTNETNATIQTTLVYPCPPDQIDYEDRRGWFEGTDLRHITTMTADVRPIKVDVLAELSNVKTVWSQLFSHVPMQPPYDKTLGSHTSNIVEARLLAKVKHEFAFNRTVATALCWLLYADYLNFGYRLPSRCRLAYPGEASR